MQTPDGSVEAGVYPPKRLFLSLAMPLSRNPCPIENLPKTRAPRGVLAERIDPSNVGRTSKSCCECPGKNAANVMLPHQGKCEEAKRLHARSLAISEKAIGADHPSFDTFLNNRAMFLVSQVGALQLVNPSECSWGALFVDHTQCFPPLFSPNSWFK